MLFVYLKNINVQVTKWIEKEAGKFYDDTMLRERSYEILVVLTIQQV